MSWPWSRSAPLLAAEPSSSSRTVYGTATLPPATHRRALSPTLLISLFSSLGGFLFGLDIGYISGVEVMESFRADVNGGREIGDAEMGLVTAIFALGAMFGAWPAVGDKLVNSFGTKFAIVVGGLAFCAGAMVQGIAWNVPGIILGRFVSGASVGLLSSHVPVYQSELAAPEDRGRMVATYQLAIALGIMAAFWLNFAVSDLPHGWRISVLTQLLPGGALAVGMLRMPHSPRGLVARGRRAEAVDVLLYLRPAGADVEAEVREIEAALAEEMSAGEASWAVLCSGTMRRITCTGIASQLIAQLCGMNVFMFYGPRIFQMVGLSGFLFSAIAGVVNFFATIPALALVDRLGRTVLLKWSAAGMCLSCAVLALVGDVAMECDYNDAKSDYSCSIKSPTAGWVASGAVFFFIFNFAYGWGPVPWIVCSEIFPMTYRAKGVGLTTTCTWLGTFIVGFFPPLLISTIELNTFWIFAGVCALGVGFALWVPETRGKSLEQVTALFDRRSAPSPPTKTAPSRTGK